MSLLRICCLSLLAIFFSGQTFAAMLSPFYNFVGVTVPNPTTPQRVKAALVNAALLQTWTIVENPDGSLTASMWKVREYDFKVRITYDAAHYSVVYLDSKGLSYTFKYSDSVTSDRDKDRLQEVETRLSESIQSRPEAAFAVKTEAHMHAACNFWIGDLLAGVRRELVAPAMP
ncbi:MAG TPA: hypothetical protein VE029_13360 [Rhizobacter sp.]|nr:hypothetical protein [Rhizobacter sp.]